MSDFDFGDINLDFLQSTPPRGTQGSNRVDSPTIKSELDIGPTVVGGESVRSKKHLAWAKKIAKADELINEIKKLKCDKLELQTQLKDFQKSALTIQTLYTTEKTANEQMSKDIKHLQEKFKRVDDDLTVKNLKCDQLEGQLAIQNDCPVEYNVLVVKYLRLLNKLDEEECKRNSTDRVMIDDLRQYCAKYKLKAPPANCSKQVKVKKPQKEDAAVQCELLKDIPVVAKPSMISQSTQCKVKEMRSQGSQHISTMTTRATTTDCFIKYRTVGTSFPEAQPTPVVDEILREFTPWQNITPISPLIDQPTVQNVAKTLKSIGTCTWLCNIRRTIDFLPRDRHQQRSQSSRPLSSCEVPASQSIKQEVTTPSPSPTPNVQTNVPVNQSDNVAVPASATPPVSTNQNTVHNAAFGLQSSLPLRHLSGSSFDSLWHIFGRMLYGLLQNSNAGIAANTTTTNQEAVNQQQFYSWLRELYDGSVTTASGNIGPAVQSEAVADDNVETSSINLPTRNSPAMIAEQSDAPATHSIATSPLHFNQISPFGSPNIIRPQARRNCVGENAEHLEETLLGDVMQPLVHTPEFLVDNVNCESNSVLTNDNESLRDTNLTKETFTSLEASEKPPKNKKNHKILNQIQELFPETKLCKSKRKALKRLLKTKKQKQTANTLQDKKINRLITSKKSLASNSSSKNSEQEETAVDFLKGIFESSNSRGHYQKTEDSNQDLGLKIDRQENNEYLWSKRKDGTNFDVKNNVEIVKVENIHSLEVTTKTNNKMDSIHHIEDNKTLQYNNVMDLSIDDCSKFKKPKNFLKKCSFSKPKDLLSKKSKTTIKKEFYTSLFGESDTDMDDSEDENQKHLLSYIPPAKDNFKDSNKTCLWETETSGDEEEVKSCSLSQKINYSDKVNNGHSMRCLQTFKQNGKHDDNMSISNRSEDVMRNSSSNKSSYSPQMSETIQNFGKLPGFTENIHFLNRDDCREDAMEISLNKNSSTCLQTSETNDKHDTKSVRVSQNSILWDDVCSEDETDVSLNENTSNISEISEQIVCLSKVDHTKYDYYNSQNSGLSYQNCRKGTMNMQNTFNHPVSFKRNSHVSETRDTTEYVNKTISSSQKINLSDEDYNEVDMEVSLNENSFNWSHISKSNVFSYEKENTKYGNKSAGSLQTMFFSDEDCSEDDKDACINEDSNKLSQHWKTKNEKYEVNIPNHNKDEKLREKCATSNLNFIQNSCNSQIFDSHGNRENVSSVQLENPPSSFDSKNENKNYCPNQCNKSIYENADIHNILGRSKTVDNILLSSQAVNDLQKNRLYENATEVFYTGIDNYKRLNQNPTSNLTNTHNISLPDIPTPILKTIEMCAMNEPTTNFLMNKGTASIDKQLHQQMESYKGEFTIPAPEDIPSDFDKDFELSSEEDEDAVSKTTFSVIKEDPAKQIHTENLQCDTSINLKSSLNFITFNGNIKPTSKIVGIINDFKEPITLGPKEICNGIGKVGGENSRIVNTTYVSETTGDTIDSECSKYSQTNNVTLNSFIPRDPTELAPHFNNPNDGDETLSTTLSEEETLVIEISSDITEMDNTIKPNDILIPENVSGKSNEKCAAEIPISPPKCILTPYFHNPEYNDENMSTTPFEEETSAIDISSDITNMVNSIKANEILISENISGKSNEEYPAHVSISPRKCILAPYFNNPEESEENMLKTLSQHETFAIDISSDITNMANSIKTNGILIPENVNGKSNEECHTNKEILTWLTDELKNSKDLKESSTSSSEIAIIKKSNNVNSILEIKSISASKDSKVASQVNSHKIISTRLKRDTFASSSDDEISALKISTDTMSIENERRNNTITPNDELIIDDGADETDEETHKNSNDSSLLNIKEIKKFSEKPKEIDSIVENIKKTELSTENAKDTFNTTSDISLLLNSTLYKDILTDPTLVDEVLRDDNLLMITPVLDKIPKKRGRKRKSECQLEEQPPCKRSERLKAQKSNLCITPVQIGKYTTVSSSKNVNHVKCKRNDKVLKEEGISKTVDTNKKEVHPNVPVVRMGFFREINDIETKESSKDIISSTVSDGKADEESLLAKDKSNSSIAFYPLTINTSLTFKNTNDETESKQTSFNIDRLGCKNANMQKISENGVANDPKLDEIESKQISLNIDRLGCTRTTVCDYSESPLSPAQNELSTETLLNTATFEISLEPPPQYSHKAQNTSLLETLISHYSPGMATANTQPGNNYTKREMVILARYETILKEYCCSSMQLDLDVMASTAITRLQQQFSIEYPLLCCALLKVSKNAESSMMKEKELPSVIQEMPPRHLCVSLQRIFYLLKHLSNLNSTICMDLLKKIDSTLFNVQQSEKMTLNNSLHLIQLYLISCKLTEHKFSQHPARFLIAKCLYFHAIKSISMIHEVLMWYPTVMPPKEDRTYDRSDALITVIQQVLMSTKYDMDKEDIRGKALLSKLRYEYHYTPFKPSLDETISNLLDKLKMSKFCNLSLAFSMLCKRMAPARTEKLIETHLLPLANEYFNHALNNTDYDEHISVILETISKVVKPFPADTNVELYLNLFSRFLNNFNRPVIQESAVCSIIRLQRFGYVNCFHRLVSFKPTFELSSTVKLMLKTFIHRKSLSFLKTITHQSRVNFN